MAEARSCSIANLIYVCERNIININYWGEREMLLQILILRQLWTVEGHCAELFICLLPGLCHCSSVLHLFCAENVSA